MVCLLSCHSSLKTLCSTRLYFTLKHNYKKYVTCKLKYANIATSAK